MKMRCLILSFVFCWQLLQANAQQEGNVVAVIKQLYADGKFREADAILKTTIHQLFTGKTPDTLSSYCAFIGKVAAKLRGDIKAKEEVIAFIQKAKSAYPHQTGLIAIFFEAAEFFSITGDNKLAYGTIEEIGQYFLAQRKDIPDKLPRIESNLGLYALRMGKLGLASKHYRESIRLVESLPNPDPERLYITYNSMGGAMWYASKLDSSIYFFEKALAVLKKLEPTPVNKYYRVAIVSNNISGCYSAQGKTTEAIRSYEKVIQNYRDFIAVKESFPQKEAAIINQYQSIDNLAKIYIELGDFTKAHDLLFYSYQQKRTRFGEQSPEVYKSLLFLGSIYYNQREFAKAEEYLLNALTKIKAEGNTGTVWEADAVAQLATVYEALNKKEFAAAYFEKADSLYEIVYEGQYNDVCLENMMSGSLFFAKNKQSGKAMGMGMKGLNYVLKTQGEHSLFSFRQLLNLADINYKLGNYPPALSYSQKALAVVNAVVKGSSDLLDSVKIEMQKPTAILLKTKAAYQLLKNKDTGSIAALLNQLNEAMQVIDQRRTILTGEKDISLMMAGYKELIDFIKQLNYEMYRLTNDGAYIDKMIGLHEATMYTRIRSRMDKQKALRFANVPAEVQQTEEELKAAISTALVGNGLHSEKIQAYFNAVNKWKEYQGVVRKQYPAYYNMRYGSVTGRSISEISQDIPQDITVVRYMYAGENLFALVAEKNRQKFIPLEVKGIDSMINLLSANNTNAEVMGTTAFVLYRQLWHPLEGYITNKRIIIIPDGILYNLSMEMLTPKPVKSYKELAAQCLLSRYAISYHYSLLGIKKGERPARIKSNYIAFAPGFSDEAKQKYAAAAKLDSLHFDNAYLRLLPLPFTINLAREIQERVGGEVFINDQSTPAAFRANAGNHNIIHIGTHAESNNLYPEYSRLIFAKDVSHIGEQNVLYLFDIYNCSLSSELAVLTACETGKPAYQDGEGMISMAHAFNYAGSESMLTSLWKIDEQSSAQITSLFYENLQKGMPKDEALRLAKLTYLEKADGRMQSPQYWAGLIIMGEVSPIEFMPKSNHTPYWIAGGACLILLGFGLYKKLTNGRKSQAGS